MGRPIGLFAAFFAFLEKVFEYERGGDLIDDAMVLLAGMAGLVKDLVSLVGGEAFVVEMDGQAGKFAECGREGLSLCGLSAFRSVEMKGIADDNAGDAKAAGEASERAQVFARVTPAFERQHRLRSKTQLVGDGYSDTAIADVKGEVAKWCGSLQALVSRHSA